MLILGIEASTQVTSVALVGATGLVAESTRGGRSTASERLLPLVQTVLEDADVHGTDVQGVAVSIGPGSFTGVRVAVSTAKGLARAWGKPAIAVSTLAAMAERFPASRLPVCVMLDARKAEVYAAIFTMTEGGPEVILPEQAITPERLCRRIDQPTLLVGEGALKYRSLFKEHLPARAVFVPGPLNAPSAASVAEIGLQKFRAGETVDSCRLLPNYIRRSEAEIKWSRNTSVRPPREDLPSEPGR